jgi:sulfur carrier protein
MEVTVEVVGEDTHAVDVEQDAVYGDVVRAVGYSLHEVTVLVDGTPVPEDQPVTVDRVKVLRLIKGGTTRRRSEVGASNSESEP